MNRRDFLCSAASGGLATPLIALVEPRSNPSTYSEETSGESTWICLACGTQYPASPHPPSACQICLDSRQYVGWNGQKWTTPDFLAQTHTNSITEEEPGLYAIHTQPDFAIGQRAFLIQTPKGNILWDCVALLDEATKAAIRQLGGIAAIAISHPHYYTTMIEWSEAFNNAPIFLHELDRKWVMRPSPAIHFWSGSTKRILEESTLIHTGGHFAGFQVLHWPAAKDGKSILLAGDQPEVCMDRRWVTFMYSYPNYIPLNRSAVTNIVTALDPFSFERLYAAFPGRILSQNAKEIVKRSADRYIRAISS